MTCDTYEMSPQGKELLSKMKRKTRPDPDGDKTIGELLDEVKELHNIEKYLQGDFP